MTKRDEHPPNRPHNVYCRCPKCGTHHHIWLTEAEWKKTWKKKVVYYWCNKCCYAAACPSLAHNWDRKEDGF